MKPTVLVFAFELMAHYTRTVVVAEALQRRFRVLFQSSVYDDLVHRSGFKTFNAGRLPEREMVADGKRDDLMVFPREALEATMLSQVEVIKKYQPAFVIGDMSTTLSMAAEMAETPYVSLVNSYLSRYYDEPFQMPKCLANFTNDIVDVPPFFRPRIQSLDGLVAVTQSQREFRWLRRKYKLSKKTNLAQELEGDQTWICDSTALHPIVEELPETVKIIGPLLYNPSFLPVTNYSQTAGRKTVLVSMGSSGEWDILRLLDNPALQHFDFLICGREDGPAEGANIHYLPFVNFNELMLQVDVVLCHGGNGTLYQALDNSVPALCLPQFFEQTFNVDKLEGKGWGAALTGNESSERLAELLNDWASVRLTDAENDIKTATAWQGEKLMKYARSLSGSADAPSVIAQLKAREQIAKSA